MRCHKCQSNSSHCTCMQEQSCATVHFGNGAPDGKDVPLDKCWYVDLTTGTYYPRINGSLFFEPPEVKLPDWCPVKDVCDQALVGTPPSGAMVLWCDENGALRKGPMAASGGGDGLVIAGTTNITPGTTEVVVCEGGEFKKAVFPVTPGGGGTVTEEEIRAAVCAAANTGDNAQTGDLIPVCTDAGLVLRALNLPTSTGGGGDINICDELNKFSTVADVSCGDHVVLLRGTSCVKAPMPTMRIREGNFGGVVRVEREESLGVPSSSADDDAGDICMPAADIPGYCLGDTHAIVHLRSRVRTDVTNPGTINATAVAIIGNVTHGFADSFYNVDNYLAQGNNQDASDHSDSDNATTFWPIQDGQICIPYSITFEQGGTGTEGTFGWGAVSFIAYGSVRSS